MPDNSSQHETLNIKKYSNRRYYDATRSRHVTLREMHDLVQEGFELKITDAKTRDDITNAVLTQIILERDAPKLDIFPANVLHQMIRTQRNLLGNVVESFFAQVLKTHQTSQEQWSSFVRKTLGVNVPNPMDWTRTMMDTFVPQGIPNPPSSAETANEQDESSNGPEIEALRRQVAELTKHVQNLSEKKRESV
jgi:polyhydroxyalkanoate synthesis repressor PhaR